MEQNVDLISGLLVFGMSCPNGLLFKRGFQFRVRGFSAITTSTNFEIIATSRQQSKVWFITSH